MRIAIILSTGLLLSGLAACGTQVTEPTEGEAIAGAEDALAQGSAAASPGGSHRAVSHAELAKAASAPVSAGLLALTQCWPLSQGPKNNDLGDVCITNDGDSIDVTYTSDGGCLLTQVHVCAATADFPWSPPGQCPYNAEFPAAPTDSYTVSVPLSDFPEVICGGTIFHIQAHAALDCTASGGGQESAYAGTFKGNIEYTLQCPDDEDESCTLTQGYWKNHAEDWSSTSLTLGGVTYSHAEALAIFGTPPKGDASLILAHQLMATKLNLEVGGASYGAVEAAVADADAWLAANADADGALPFGVASESAAGAEAVALSVVLDDYNNGLIGPGHCE